MIELSDEQVISQYLKEGGEPLLELLFSRYLKPVFSVVFHYVGSRTAAEDITQEVFVKAWKNLKKFDPKKSFKTWILAIARNSSIDFLRKKKELVFSDFESEDRENVLADALQDPGPLPLQQLQAQDFAAELETALAQLPPASRAVLLLRLHEELTFKEIAKFFKQPLDTVKSRYRRGVFALRKILERQKIEMDKQGS